ncbi:MAG: deoxyhypusine synthase [bacterium]
MKGINMTERRKIVKSRKDTSHCKGKRILPDPIKGCEKVVDIVENYFDCFNAGRLRECCELLTNKIIAGDDVTVGLSLSGALTPAGLGISSIIPLMKAGFIDWISTTGANLYHDTHFALGFSLHRRGPIHDDIKLRRDKIVRIYDILFDYKVLLNTDAFYRRIFVEPEFRTEMSTSELHYRIGKYVTEREKALGLKDVSILSVAHRLGIPIYSPAPADSSIGMNIAEAEFDARTVYLNVSRDINEATGIILKTKRGGGKSAVIILGGGSPKNFMLQTEPQIQEVLGIKDKGHDYFIQITDARPDTGGLSGATPSEAVTWGKVDKDMLPDAVVCYTDVSIALPILASYALAKAKKRRHKRLYDKREEYVEFLKQEYLKARSWRLRNLGMTLKEAKGKINQK